MDGAEETFRVDRDENIKSRTQRRMSACLRKVLDDLLPASEPNELLQKILDDKRIHVRRDSKKGRNSLFLGGDGLCTMSPVSPNITRESFLWNLPTLETYEIDKTALLDAVMPMFDRPEDTIEWSL